MLHRDTIMLSAKSMTISLYKHKIWSRILLKGLLYIFFTQILVINCLASYNHLKFEHLSKKHGLPNSYVNAIIQDQNGFMWFATESGLARYDGYSFTLYEFSSIDTNTVSSNSIKSIAEDKFGKIWIATYGGGVNVYDPSTKKITYFKHDPNDLNSLSNDYILTLFADSKGTIWISTDGGGLQTFNRENNNFNHLLTTEEDPTKLNTHLVYEICEDNSGTIWFGAVNGLFQYDYSNGTFKRHLPNPDDVSAVVNSISAVTTDLSGNVWVGSAGGDVFKYDKNNDSFSQLDVIIDEGLIWRKAGIISIFVDKAGILWIGSWDGLTEYNIEDKSFNFFHHNDSEPFSLCDGSIISIFQDRAEIIWFGTADGGISKLNRRKNSFNHKYPINNNEGSLSNKLVNAIAVQSSGTLWIGTTDGLNKYKPGEDTYQVFLPIEGDETSISSYAIKAIYEDNAGMLWIGTGGAGLNRWEENTQSFMRFSAPENDPNCLNEVSTILNDKDGKLWIGTSNLGISIIDTYTNDIVRHVHNPNNPNSVSSLNILSLYKDLNGSMWVGTGNGGLDKYDTTSNTFTHYGSNIEGNSIYSIYEDSLGTFWVGTDYGLNKFNLEEGTSRLLTKKDGLAGGAVYGILEDGFGNFWLATNKGITKYSLKDSTVTNYDELDGLQGNEFRVGSYHKSKSGELFFGGNNGYNRFYSEQIISNSYPPQIAFTDFNIFNQSKEFEKDLSELELIKLSYKDNFFSFKFAALDYSASEKNQYAYMLMGVDKDWVYTENNRIASYTNIDPGKYKFKVKGSNNHGLWNEEIKTISIHIRPPFWKTWLFIVFVILVIAVGIYKFYKDRTNRIRARQKLLEDKIHKGEKIVETKVQEVEKQKEEIRLRDVAEQELRYINQGLAKFSKIISHEHGSLDSLSQVLITGIMDYTSSLQGLIYILVENGNNKQKLELKGQYGVDNESLKKTILLGEGFVGTCFNSGKIIELNELPESYTKIDSGLGSIAPNYLILIPLKQNNILNGVLEISAFKPLEGYKKNFLVTLCETISSSVNTVLINEKINTALKKSEQQTEELHNKEEQLLQSLEEMQATQEEVQRQTENIHLINEKLVLERNSLNTVLKQSSDFIFIKDTSDKFNHISKNKHPLYPAFQSSVLIGNFEKDFLADHSAKEFLKIEQNIIKTGQPLIDYEQIATDVRGNKIKAIISRYPFFDDNKKIIGIVGFIK